LEVLKPTKSHRDALQLWVKSLRLAKTLPGKVLSVWRVDLDGDGKKETLIEAATKNLQSQQPGDTAPGDYSAVLWVSKDKAGKVKVKPLGAYVEGKKKDNTPYHYGLAFCFDLNGDGHMEVLVSTHYYEGGGMFVYSWQSGGLKRVLSYEDGT
ncbi:MAG: hypothetical protein JRH20_22390, partial [Deltaproteobacteria bacterium]|nr:hypothetical protein [Deltaproteobacteria bacterium]